MLALRQKLRSEHHVWPNAAARKSGLQSSTSAARIDAPDSECGTSARFRASLTRAPGQQSRIGDEGSGRLCRAHTIRHILTVRGPPAMSMHCKSLRAASSRATPRPARAT